MTINISMPVANTELKPRIVVVGVGGAGGNAVENMIRSQLEGVEFLVANTDAQALSLSSSERRIQLGATVTQGLGAGARPDVGRAAAEEGLDEIIDQLQGCHMVFITAGMGGGTGTGGAPVIARAARELGILTVGVITKPFHFEGMQRMRTAEQGIEDLQHYVDTLIVIPNQNLFRVANEKTTFADAFKMADDVLHSGVRGVTDLMVMPGLINLDFADIRSVMSEMGKAMMGTGEADSDKRALDAAEAAISNPLLDDISMKGARGILINITGGSDMTLFEVDEAANRIRDEVDPEANIIFGSTFYEGLEGKMRVSVVATGIDADEMTAPKPVPLSLVATQGRRIEEKPEESAGDDTPAVAEGDPPPRLLVAEIEIPDHPLQEQPAAAARATIEPPVAKSGPALTLGTSPAVSKSSAAAIAETAPGAEISTDGTFIAPRPVEPAKRPESAGPAPVDPFEAADLANGRGGVAKPKRRSPSLFSRVTNAARSRAPAGPPAARASVTPAQARLGGLDPAERVKTSEVEEEDLLDIPAFLRRQAN